MPEPQLQERVKYERNGKEASASPRAAGGIDPGGGGGAASALLSAIFTFPTGRSDIQLQGGQIFSATDASARDASLGPQVQAEASRRGITLDQILTGDCTTDSGPVDDTIEQVTFLATSATTPTRPALLVTRPDGNPAATTDPDVTARTLSTVVSLAVATPAVGSWRVVLSGNGSVVLRAFARTELRANGLRFLSEDVVPARPEIELEDIDGQPLVGDALVADVRFTTPVADADLSLVRNDGTVVDTPLLLPLDGSRRFRAELTVPSESSLLLELTGTTLAGNPFLRQITSPVLPQTVAIRAEPGVSIGPVGGSAPIDLTLTNRGTTAGTFVFIVSTRLGWGVTFLTGPVTVEAGATVTLTAEDGNGGSCSGTVSVGVPKSQGSGAAVDSGQSFDSTVDP